jgi:hypothetical protein
MPKGGEYGQMTEDNTGFKRIIGIPAVYNLFNSLPGQGCTATEWCGNMSGLSMAAAFST